MEIKDYPVKRKYRKGKKKYRKIAKPFIRNGRQSSTICR